MLVIQNTVNHTAHLLKKSDVDVELISQLVSLDSNDEVTFKYREQIKMKIILNKEEHTLLKEIVKNSVYENLIPDELEFSIDEDSADEIREMCVDIETYECMEPELSNRGKLAISLVDKFFIG